jgi:hypothetical protein
VDKTYFISNDRSLSPHLKCKDNANKRIKLVLFSTSAAISNKKTDFVQKHFFLSTRICNFVQSFNSNRDINKQHLCQELAYMDRLHADVTVEDDPMSRTLEQFADDIIQIANGERSTTRRSATTK